MSDITQTFDAAESGLLARKLDALGPYRLSGIIGEGGMGSVYRALQLAPVRREVAIKVTRVDLASAGRLARFQSECQILATLAHPNVAQVFDTGETPEGYPYLVMEYIDGEPIDLYCDRERLGVGARLQLMIEACNAVTHAHQHGVIHRDIKPSNLLVDRRSGRPMCKLIDFGIAKWERADHQGLTETGRSPGTPAYMSPEQLRAAPDIDIRTDVFALGMTLFRLLAGSLPPTAGTPDGHTPRPSRRLASSENAGEIAARCGAVSPRQLARELARDLDWIVLKATAPERERRYDSVAALAEDLRRFLGGFPVQAAPPSAAYTLLKLVRRHRFESAAAVLLVLGVLVSSALLAWAFARERAALAQAEAQLHQHEAFNAFVLELMTSMRPSRPGEDVTLRETLDQAALLLPKRFADDPVSRMALTHMVQAARASAGLGAIPAVETGPAEPVP